MSGSNTKSSKIDRILTRQAEADLQLSNIFALMRLNRETDTATIAEQAATIKTLTATNQMLAAVAQSQESKINRLQKYLGSVLFKRRRLESASDVAQRLEPKWGAR